MPAREHQFERASSIVTDWLEQMSTKAADTIRGGGRAPFAAPANESQKLAYYEQKLFNPDGSENVQGGMEEMHRLGINAYLQLKAEILKARQERMSGMLPGQEVA